MTPSSPSACRALSVRLLVVICLLAGIAGVQLAVAPVPAEASHFRSAQLTWHSVGGRTVEFHFSQGLRRSAFGAPGVGSTISPGQVTFGDGQWANISATVVQVDAANDWILVDAHLPHTYAANGPYTAQFNSCCRLSAPAHRNNPDGNLRAVTTVNLAATTASPVSSISPIVDCPISAMCQFFIPASDADNQPIRWRMATAAEAAGSSFAQPTGATVNATTGLYTWKTTGANLAPSGDSYFSTQVVIENVVNNAAVSQSAVDFFIRVTSAANPNLAPSFTGATPADGAVFSTPVNSSVSFTVSASDPNAGDTVTLGIIGLPGTASFTKTNGNPANGTFTWTPTTVGDTILTLTAQDNVGRGALQRSVIIRAGDNVPPVVSVPAAVTVEATGPSGAPVSYPPATATDNVNGSLPASCLPAPGSVFALGTTTVNCSATDSSGNIGQASFTVTVQDTTPPALSGLSDLTLGAVDAGGAAASFDAKANDLVDGAVPAVCTPASGSRFAIGTTTVACSATDSRGNKSSGTFLVVVADNTAPVLSLPTGLTAEATGPGGAAVSFAPTAVDAVSGSVPVVCSPPSGLTFALGMTTVSCSATDPAGNRADGTFPVLVEDTTEPTLVIPADVAAEATGPGGTLVSWTATASDIVDGDVAVSCSATSGATFGIGSHTVTCLAQDAAGNVASGSFPVVVSDTTAPELNTSANLVVEATGPHGATADFVVDAVDIVDGPVVPACSAQSGEVFPLGVTTVSCTATDTHNNAVSHSFTVTVSDTLPPVVDVPAGLSFEASGPKGATGTFTVLGTDAVDGPVVVDCTPPSGSTFPLGLNTVSCTATDSHGNTGSRSFVLLVTDETAPTLQLPAGITAEATSAAGAPVSYTATASDLVDGLLVPACAPAPGSVFALGSTTVECSASDNAGNHASGSFTVTVEDTTVPVVTVPEDIIAEATGPDGAAVGYPDARASDLVDGDIGASCGMPSGSLFPAGTTTVVCSATDGAGNKGQATFKVTVRDSTAPAVTAPRDIIAEAAGPSGAIVTYAAAKAVDIVDGVLPADCIPPSGSTFAIGTTAVSCTAVDKAGNDGHASFSVTVQDTTPPVVHVPADITEEATGANGAAVIWPAATASDVVDGPLAATCTPTAGSVFALGVTIVTCMAQDSHGNTGSATFKVTVTDRTAPQVTTSDDLLAEATGPSGAAVAYTVNAADIVDGAVATNCSQASGTVFPIGMTTVTCTATDKHHNTGQASFTVTVVDTTAPTVTWSGNKGEYSVAERVTIICSASDLATGVASTTGCRPITGLAAEFGLGEHSYTATATDRAGNTGGATTTFDVNVTPASLCSLVRLYVTKTNVADSLCKKLDKVDTKNPQSAAAELPGFRAEVNANIGKSITAAQAAVLLNVTDGLLSQG